MFFILWSSNIMLWLVGYGLLSINSLENIGIFILVMAFMEAVTILALYNIRKEKRLNRSKLEMSNNYISLKKKKKKKKDDSEGWELFDCDCLDFVDCKKLDCDNSDCDCNS